eukprot:5348752-Karenia_brevis.AAC.1
MCVLNTSGTSKTAGVVPWREWPPKVMRISCASHAPPMRVFCGLKYQIAQATLLSDSRYKPVVHTGTHNFIRSGMKSIITKQKGN